MSASSSTTAASAKRRVKQASWTMSKTPCCSKVGIKKGPWTPEEDDILTNFVQKEGEGQWRTLPKRAGLQRCGKSCRLRWMNYLRPSVKRGRITLDEEDLILRLHRLLGNRWALIAGRIPGRTDNEIKNYWNTHLSKKLIRQGIDPRTHKPLINTTTTTTSSSNGILGDSQKVDHESNTTSSNPNPIPQPIGINPALEFGSSGSQTNISVPSAGELDYGNIQGHDGTNGSNGNGEEDTFLLFLDSLMDGSDVSTPLPLQDDAIFPLPLNPSTSFAQPFNFADWEAEFNSALNEQNCSPSK